MRTRGQPFSALCPTGPNGLKLTSRAHGKRLCASLRAHWGRAERRWHVREWSTAAPARGAPLPPSSGARPLHTALDFDRLTRSPWGCFNFGTSAKANRWVRGRCPWPAAAATAPAGPVAAALSAIGHGASTSPPGGHANFLISFTSQLIPSSSASPSKGSIDNRRQSSGASGALEPDRWRRSRRSTKVDFGTGRVGWRRIGSHPSMGSESGRRRSRWSSTQPTMSSAKNCEDLHL